MNRRRFWNSLLETFEGLARARALTVLGALDDAQLAAMGVSRELLEQGVDAWPWRPDEHSTSPPTSSNMSPPGLGAFEVDLGAYSDGDLLDLGLSRDDLRGAILSKRPNVDYMTA